MIKGTKIDVSGTVHDAAEDAIQSISGMLVVAVLFTCLIAPYWADVFEHHYMQAYNVNKYPLRYKDVQAKMVGVKIMLWLVAIFSWTFVLGTYIASGSEFSFMRKY